jgi:type I restriction enzyme S subunit
MKEAQSSVTSHQSNSLYSLPVGWVWTTLGETTNPSQKRVNPKNFPELPYIGMENVEAQSMRLLGTVPAKEMRSAADSFSPGDVLYGRLRPYLNKVVSPDFSGLCSTEFIIFRKVHHIHSKYLQYFLNSWDFVQFANSLNAGDRPRVKVEQLAGYPFPLPPLPVQEHIVARLEELLSDLEAGVRALERVRAGLMRYKASVLKAAFEGHLVHQEEYGEPATVLLERVLGKDYAKEIAPSELSKVPYVPSGWAFGKLENLIYIAGRIGWRGLKADEYTQEGPLFLSVYNLNKGDHVDFNDVHHISQDRYDESPEIILQESDILLAKDGAGIGKIGIVIDLPGQATVNSSLLVIRASKIFIPEFLFYLLKGPQMQDIVRTRIAGSATPHLFQRDIKQFTLLIPPLGEQRLIVVEVERRLEAARAAEAAADAGMKRAARLRQSVLRAAFEGRL